MDLHQIETDQLTNAIKKAFADYDRSLTGKAAASDCTNRLYDALRSLAKEQGQDPLYEVHAWRKGLGNMDRSNDSWGVSWEAGPYQWAIQASFLLMDLTGRLAEPHYSFDICFYEVE